MNAKQNIVKLYTELQCHGRIGLGSNYVMFHTQSNIN